MKLSISKIKWNYISVYTLLIILCIFQCIGSSTLCIMTTGVILAFSLLWKVGDVFVLIFLTVPFFNMMNASIGSTSMFYVLIGIFLIRYTMTYRFTKKRLIVIASVVFLTVYNLSFEYIRWLLLIIPLFISFNEGIIERNITKIINYYSLSMVISGSFGLFMLNKGISIYTRGYVYSTTGSVTRFAGLIGDAVIFSQMIAILVSANLILILFHKSSILNWFYVVILSYFVMLTYSKTGILLIVIALLSCGLFYIINNSSKRNTIWKSALGIGMGLLIFYGVMNYIITHINSNKVIATMMIRLSSGDLMTGRAEVFRHYVALWKESISILFRGIGFSTYVNERAVISSTLEVAFCHNIYIEMVTMFGLFQSIIIVSWIIFQIYKFLKYKKPIILLLPVMLIIVSGFVVHGFMEFGYSFSLIIALYFCCECNWSDSVLGKGDDKNV